jgi:hypothetical protein
MMPDMDNAWTIDRAAGTATHRETGMELYVVQRSSREPASEQDHPSRPTLYARLETVQGLVAVTVERLMREGNAAYRGEL